MSRVDAKCSCGDELHVSAWLSANTAAFYEAFMQEHATCRIRARLSILDPVLQSVPKAPQKTIEEVREIYNTLRSKYPPQATP